MNKIVQLWGQTEAVLVSLLNSPGAPYLLGLFLPWMIAVVQQKRWSKSTRTCLMLVFCFVATMEESLRRFGRIDKTTFLLFFLQTVIATAVLYHGVYKHLGMPGWESVTSAMVSKVKAAVTTARNFGVIIEVARLQNSKNPAPLPSQDIVPEQLRGDGGGQLLRGTLADRIQRAADDVKEEILE